MRILWPITSGRRAATSTNDVDEDAVWNLPMGAEGKELPELVAFDTQKWRSGLGAYFFDDCTARRGEDGTWTYTVGDRDDLLM